MAKTVVGLFEGASDAEATQRDLESMGLGSDTTTYVRKHEPQLSNRLVEAGIPQQDAKLFADGVGQGNQLIVVQGIADDDAADAAAVMDRHNVIDISRMKMSGQSTTSTTSTTSSSTTSGTAGGTTRRSTAYEGQDMVVPIVEEQLSIGKRAVERGGVRVRTRIEEVPVSEQVTLREETVQVDRRPVDRAVTDADMAAMQQGTFEVRETDEEAVVAKEARVVEEVVVKKDVGERTETVQDSVRRTKVDVDEVSGQTTSRGTTMDVDTTSTTTSGATMDVNTSSTAGDEGAIERGASKLGNAVERATGADLDSDGDVGRRDPRNNV